MFLFLIFQSCETGDSTLIDQKIESNEKFYTSLKISLNKVKSIKLDQQMANNYDSSDNLLKSGLKELSTSVCLYHDDNNSNEDEFIIPEEDLNLGEVSNINGINVGLSDSEGNISDNSPSGEPVICFEVPNEPTIESLNPAVVEAKNYLKIVDGFSDADIREMLDGEDETLLIPLVTEIIAIRTSNSLAQNKRIKNNYFIPLFGIEYANASTRMIQNDAWGCAKEAIGVAALAESFDAVRSGNKYLLKKAGVKALKKLAKRFLGPIGVAIAIADFAWCMSR